MTELIYSYSRKQALEDGVLIDVSEMAKEAGIKVPVALTQEMHATYIVTELNDQDEQGRVWDTLFMLVLNAKNSRESIIHYNVIFRMIGDRDENATLKAVIGPGDSAEPVITIMLPHES